MKRVGKKLEMESDMSTGETVAVVVGVAILGLIAVNIKDLIRYIKISNM